MVLDAHIRAFGYFGGVPKRMASATAPASMQSYEKTPLIIKANLNFAEWVQVFGDEKMTTALLDRVAHTVHPGNRQ